MQFRRAIIHCAVYVFVHVDCSVDKCSLRNVQINIGRDLGLHQLFRCAGDRCMSTSSNTSSRLHAHVLLSRYMPDVGELNLFGFKVEPSMHK